MTGENLIGNTNLFSTDTTIDKKMYETKKKLMNNKFK